MSQISLKELQLTSAVFKNFNGNFLASVDWDQVAREAGYKDNKNAKTMWSRLEKKLIDAAARPAGHNNDDDAGENLPAPPAKAGTKRKAAGDPRGIGPVFKRVYVPIIKKPHQVAANVNTDGSSSKVETSIKEEGEEEGEEEAT